MLTFFQFSLMTPLTSNKSKSFKQDIITIERKFNTNILSIAANVEFFKNKLKEKFNLKDKRIGEITGLKDNRIMTCLHNFKCKFHKNFLFYLMKCKI